MIRRWTRDDAVECYDVYLEAVRNGASEHYNRAQRLAWAPSDEPPESWSARLEVARVWVSEDAQGMTGFISLDDEGYLDLFFVAPRARGDGTAASLYAELLAEAEAQGLKTLRTHASLYLRPFLEKRGWTVVQSEEVERSGVTLRRFEMTWRAAQPDSQAS
ncbi:MAG: GNAT family N-acetyltransferase [Paracoccaceae bacterium]|nr:GNAT family N-acetyltransferase [Paracoccaceae bacterium]